ncbi:hypothetical protein NIES4103_27990 [Nostoc sp. NIES-4103]|nr:hypothetical protein NIES4103_27990 [Nostoc sp. NIES-4103]
MFPRVRRVLELENKALRVVPQPPYKSCGEEWSALITQMTYREYWEYQSIKRSQEVPPDDLELEMMKVLGCNPDN